MSRRWFFRCFQLENAFVCYIGKDKSKDEASLLGRKSYLLEVESYKAKTAAFYLVLLLCGIRQFTLQFAYENLNSNFCDFFSWRDCMSIILLVLYIESKRCPLLYKILFFF